MDIAIAILIGLMGGALGGLFGVGGGIIMVPAMVYLLGFGQHRAQGTSLLTLLLPVGIFSVLNYHKAGNIDFRVGLWIAAGFVGGAYVGSRIALDLPEYALRKGFAVFIVAVGIHMFFRK